MGQALFLSLAAGIASALLSGVLTPGSLLASLLFVVAPLPLMIVGFGWHPLVAALGALVGCLLMDLGISHMAALYYGLMIGLPAYLLCEFVPRIVPLMVTGDGTVAGRRGGGFLYGGIGLYAVLVVLGGAMLIEPDFDGFVRRVSQTVEAVFRGLGGERGPLALPGGADLTKLAQLYANMLPPMLTFLVAMMLTLSLWLAIRVVRTSGRLAFAVPPAYTLGLPREVLLVFAGGLGVAQLGGYVGLFGTLVMVAVLFALILNGFAVLHARTLGGSARPLMLGAAWAAVLMFGLPAFFMAMVGAADTAFDFRRLGGGPQT